MKPHGLTAGALARRIGLKDRSGIERLVRGQQSMTPDMAIRLGVVFGNSPQFWMNLQSAYDLSRLDIRALVASMADIHPLEPKP